ncbi:hypothetical protein ACFU6J_39050, partial [Streptomyces gardneri]
MSALGNPAVRLLAARSLRTHRKAWAAVFAAVVVTSALLGALALAIGSAGLGHARVERYAAAPVVVAGDQEISWTTDPWGSEPTTVSAGLTERVRIPSAAVDVLREVPGVRAAVPDDTFVVREPGKGTETGTAAGGGGAAYTGRSWEAAALAPYKLLDGREPRTAGEVVAGTGSGTGTGAGPGTGTGAGVRVGDTVAGRTVVGVADGPAAALYVTAPEARRLAGHPGAVDAVGILGEPG